MLRARLVLAAPLLLFALAACEGRGGEAPPASVTTTVAADPGFATPRVGECRGPITVEVYKASSDDRPAVPCDQPHGSETISVRMLPAAAAALPHAIASGLAADSSEIADAVDRCDEDLQRHVGTSPIGFDAVRPSNLAFGFFIPTADEWAQGARWIRCDALTEPFEGQDPRSTTERLRGIVARDPLPASLRRCYREVQPPPTRTLVGFTSCDRPHQGEVLLRFQVTDPKVYEVAGDPAALQAYVEAGFSRACIERVAARVGLPVAELENRTEIAVLFMPLQVGRWPADPNARRVDCIVATETSTVGTLEGLGAKPLPVAPPLS